VARDKVLSAIAAYEKALEQFEAASRRRKERIVALLEQLVDEEQKEADKLEERAAAMVGAMGYEDDELGELLVPARLGEAFESIQGAVPDCDVSDQRDEVEEWIRDYNTQVDRRNQIVR